MLIDDCHVSYINLSHRKDRDAGMIKELERIGLPVHRTPGLLPVAVIDVLCPRERLRVMWNRTPGAIGCHFSQVHVMKEARRMEKHAWVMEDDLRFCDDIHARLDRIEAFMQTHEWDIIWMGGTVHVGPPHWWAGQPLMRDAEVTDDPHFLRSFGAFCTYSYIVNRKSIDKVLEGLDHWLDRSMGIDWAMIMIQPTLFTYTFVPGCCIQYDNMSDIGKGVTRFSNFKALGPYWFARRMSDFDPRFHDWKEAQRPWEPKLYPMATEGIAEPARVLGPLAARRAAFRTYVSREEKMKRQGRS